MPRPPLRTKRARNGDIPVAPPALRESDRRLVELAEAVTSRIDALADRVAQRHTIEPLLNRLLVAVEGLRRDMARMESGR